MTRNRNSSTETATGITGDTNPATPSSDPVSAAAPGVRTEAEVLADAAAAAERAANSAPPGATGNPVVTMTDAERAKAAAEAEQDDDEDEPGDLVHFARLSDGEVQSVNEGSVGHEILASDGEWEQTTRSKARARDRKRTAV